MELIVEFEQISRQFMKENGYTKIHKPKSKNLNGKKISFTKDKSEIEISLLGWDNYHIYLAKINGDKLRTIDLGEYEDPKTAAMDLMKSIENKIRPAANNGEHS